MSDKKGITIDLNNLNPAVAFPFGEATIWLRLLTPADLEDLRVKFMKKDAVYKPNPERGDKLERVEFEGGDDKGYNEEVWNLCIVKWEDFYDKDGNDFPCTKENKLLLMNGSSSFASFIGDSLKQMRKDLEESRTVTSKNVQTS